MLTVSGFDGMRFFSTRVLKVFAVIICLVGALAITSRWAPGFGLWLLPVDWPGIFVLGDEWEPSLGIWGARVASVLFSVPTTYVLAWLWCRFVPQGNERR